MIQGSRGILITYGELRLYVILTKPEWKVGESKDILYINYSHENNITKLYNWHTDRPNYWGKVQNEIKNQMIPNNNFYRSIFE